MKILKQFYREEGSFDMMKNNIVFNYTVPEYKKYLNAEYQYLLEGFQDDWSEWSTKRCEFLCLLASMCLKLGLNLQILYSHTAVYSFTVLKPWYRSTVALFFYL
jgi:hypothetical protein